MHYLRRLGGAVALGALLGVLARLVMRLIAIVAGAVEGFSFGAFVEIVLFGILVGAPVALGYDAVRSRMPWRGWGTGVALGVAMFAVAALMPPPAAQSAMAATNDPPLVTAGFFLAMFLVFGLAVEWWAGEGKRADG